MGDYEIVRKLREFATNYGCDLDVDDAERAAATIVELAEALEELDAEIDRQLYDEEFVKGCRDNGLDIPVDCEHHVIITERLRRIIARSIPSRLKGDNNVG